MISGGDLDSAIRALRHIEPCGSSAGKRVINEFNGHREIMTRNVSPEDRRFIADLEAGRIEPNQFDHRAHVRAAYVYLVENGPDQAAIRMRDTLLAFLERHGVDRSKYHETITKAWILAVRHFMDQTPAAECADAFIEANPRLLDSKIMLTHYSAELLFSAAARAAFVEPDLGAIPRHYESPDGRA